MDEYTSDITIIVNQKRFPAHKFMLYSRSEVFKKLFFDKRGCNSNEIVLYDTTELAFETMLLYCYNKEFSLECVNKVIDVYKLSQKFQISCLMEVCVEAIKEMMDCESLMVICEFAMIYRIRDLMNEIRQFAQTKSDQILNSQHIMTLSKDSSLKVFAFIINYMKVPQTTIINTIKQIRLNNDDLDITPLKEAINLLQCDVHDIELLRDLNLFTERELFDALKAKYLNLEHSRRKDNRK
jgi:hypothetical protein